MGARSDSPSDKAAFSAAAPEHAEGYFWPGAATTFHTADYENVLHRAPDEGGGNYWIAILDQQRDTPAGVLASFSESPENQEGVSLLIGVGNGIAYSPWG